MASDPATRGRTISPPPCVAVSKERAAPPAMSAPPSARLRPTFVGYSQARLRQRDKFSPTPYTLLSAVFSFAVSRARVVTTRQQCAAALPNVCQLRVSFRPELTICLAVLPRFFPQPIYAQAGRQNLARLDMPRCRAE